VKQTKSGEWIASILMPMFKKASRPWMANIILVSDTLVVQVRCRVIETFYKQEIFATPTTSQRLPPRCGKPVLLELTWWWPME
jgi:hypothetical protein